MDNRTTTILTFVVLAAMGFLLLFNLTNIFAPAPYEKFIGLNDVRGSAVQHKGQLFTLNFDQQTFLLESINRAIQVQKEVDAGGKEFPIDKIILYRFGKPDVELTPLGFYGANLVFSAPALSPKSNLQEISGGSLRDMLLKTYDP